MFRILSVFVGLHSFASFFLLGWRLAFGVWRLPQRGVEHETTNPRTNKQIKCNSSTTGKKVQTGKVVENLDGKRIGVDFPHQKFSHANQHAGFVGTLDLGYLSKGRSEFGNKDIIRK